MIKSAKSEYTVSEFPLNQWRHQRRRHMLITDIRRLTGRSVMFVLYLLNCLYAHTIRQPRCIGNSISGRTLMKASAFRHKRLFVDGCKL